jgi:hypothetical protein
VDLELARADLMHALQAETRSGARFAAAHTILIDRGQEAFDLPASGARSLHDIVRIAADAPPSRARRDFAVLLVHALGVSGLLPNRGEAEAAVRSFLERALLNPLRRAGYPFDGTPYDKRGFLAALHVSIDEHLRPPEPSIPRWIHGGATPGEG